MAGHASILSDDSTLSRIDRTFFKIETALALLGGLAVFSLMILAVISVGGRNFFNQPLPGYVDWIEQLMPLIALIGVAYCQRLGGHIRMDILIGRLKGRFLWGAEFFSTLLMLIVIWFWALRRFAMLAASNRFCSKRTKLALMTCCVGASWGRLKVWIFTSLRQSALLSLLVLALLLLPTMLAMLLATLLSLWLLLVLARSWRVTL